jgi:hypothetical protein
MSLLALQSRIRSLLAADEWFAELAAENQLFVEDRAGLEFLANSESAHLGKLAIIVQSAAGENNTAPQGALYLRERLTILFVETPLYNGSDKHVAEAVDRAMAILHEAPVAAPLTPSDATPKGYMRFHVLGHEALGGRHTLRQHIIHLVCHRAISTRLAILLGVEDDAPIPPPPAIP